MWAKVNAPIHRALLLSFKLQPNLSFFCTMFCAKHNQPNIQQQRNNVSILTKICWQKKTTDLQSSLLAYNSSDMSSFLEYMLAFQGFRMIQNQANQDLICVPSFAYSNSNFSAKQNCANTILDLNLTHFYGHFPLQIKMADNKTKAPLCIQSTLFLMNKAYIVGIHSSFH